MKKIIVPVSCLMFVAGMAFAGSVDPSAPPSSGSGMYTLQNLYDYLTGGTALSVQESFQEPGAGPGSTMKSTRQIGDAVKAMFDQCNAAVSDVRPGKKFFCPQSGSWGVKGGSASGLLKTGQKYSQQTGDDGTYQKGIAYSYSWDVGTTTVKDNVTGLIWASDGNGAGCCAGTVMYWPQAVEWADRLTFAGYTDWRLPNVRELRSLLVHDYIEAAPHINKTFFPNTSNAYWTSTTAVNVGNPPDEDAFFVEFLSCATQEELKIEGMRPRVRAVRGGE